MKYNQAARNAFALFFPFLLLLLSLAGCGGNGASPTPTPTKTANFVVGLPKNPFKVTDVKMSVSPTSIAGKPCGSSLTVTYTATFSVLEDGQGGYMHFLYTTNNGRSTTPATLTFSPRQPANIYTFTWSGILSPDHVSPGLGGVVVTSPNPLTAVPVKPSGTCLS